MTVILESLLDLGFEKVKLGSDSCVYVRRFKGMEDLKITTELVNTMGGYIDRSQKVQVYLTDGKEHFKFQYVKDLYATVDAFDNLRKMI